MMQTIGFTGTRNGMTKEQHQRVKEIVKLANATTAVHGDCLGADEDFHNICHEQGLEINIRPCTFANMRANCDGNEIAEPVAPMQRNRMIVDDADLVIACPPNYVKIKTGSGTWATIGFAKRANKKLIIVFPDGTLEASS